jgi:hypothetical protein
LQKGPYSYSISNCSPQISKDTLGFSKIVLDISLATFQKLQISPQNYFRHIFATATPILVILAPKFLKYFTLSFHAFIIHVYCILIDYAYTSRLGNAVPEPFSEDFQDQALEESQLFFMGQQGKLP